MQKLHKGLPYKFWNTPAWNKDFKAEIIKASKLLQKWSDVAILRALDLRQNRWMYSLLPAKLEPFIKIEQESYERELSSRECEPSSQEVQDKIIAPSRPQKSGRNLMGEI